MIFFQKDDKNIQNAAEQGYQQDQMNLAFLYLKSGTGLLANKESNTKF